MPFLFVVNELPIPKNELQKEAQELLFNYDRLIINDANFFPMLKTALCELNEKYSKLNKIYPYVRIVYKPRANSDNEDQVITLETYSKIVAKIELKRIKGNYTP